MESVRILIFSKDRACQLDSLLRSIVDHWRLPTATLTVLYRATDERFAAGYREVIAQDIVPGVRWRSESDFEADFRAVLDGVPDDAPMVMLVDDDIVFRPIEGDGLIVGLTSKHLFITLRADCSHARYELPAFLPRVDGLLEWRWNYRKGPPTPWGYPFSLDGNIVRAGTVKRLVRRLRYHAPNSLEGALHRARHRWWVKRIRFALAPPAGVVFNNPLNRVQTEGETYHRDITAAELNECYLSGRRIDNAMLYEQSPDDVHFSVAPRYESFVSRSVL